MVVGCYHPPSASSEAILLLTDMLHSWSNFDLVLMGDLNWDWLSQSSDSFKDICNSLCLEQLISSPTHLNGKSMSKSSLIDIILTNIPHVFSAIGVFCNDLSDHCAISCVRNFKLPKSSPRFIFKRQFKHFNEQAFLHDVYNSDLQLVSSIPDVVDAWDYFKSTFLKICDKHAPLRRYRVSGKNNPWFSESVSNLIKQRNLAWSKAKKKKNK